MGGEGGDGDGGDGLGGGGLGGGDGGDGSLTQTHMPALALPCGTVGPFTHPPELKAMQLGRPSHSVRARRMLPAFIMSLPGKSNP